MGCRRQHSPKSFGRRTAHLVKITGHFEHFLAHAPPGCLLCHRVTEVTPERLEVFARLRGLGPPRQAGPGRLGSQALPLGAGSACTQQGSSRKVMRVGAGRTQELSKALEPSGPFEVPPCLVFIVVPRSAEIITAQFLPP